ncbi:hypothetical protein GCM10007161_11950 [Ignatzschineria indica]|uniref:Uncharacterized protein n=1 Tax=Ignatzschineria indica TaxID=472583 RepID=A0A2U2AK98_9GAMM|nr:hypothetical protein [Ignatzschineria indica]PWD83189.1 hypothetical protein DC082_07185 [Ignatzschineria indica]GGZ82213.1 hypothetical protein GCM10007161_11950 [Ignatzschineria indica]
MLLTDLLNLLLTQRQKENLRIKRERHFNNVLLIANEFSAETPKAIDEKITKAEIQLQKAPFWRRKELKVLTEALYHAQKLINRRHQLMQNREPLSPVPFVLLRKEAA